MGPSKDPVLYQSVIGSVMMRQMWSWAFHQSGFIGETIWGDWVLGVWTPGDFLQERGCDSARKRSLYYMPQRGCLQAPTHLVFTLFASSTLQRAEAGCPLPPVLCLRSVEHSGRTYPNHTSILICISSHCLYFVTSSAVSTGNTWFQTFSKLKIFNFTI